MRHIWIANHLFIGFEIPLMNGLKASARLNFEYSHSPLVVINMHMEKAYLKNILSSGFKVFTCRSEIAKRLLNATKLVLKNKFVFPD